VSQIHRGNIIGLLIQHRLRQLSDPFRGNTAQIGIDHHTSPCLEPPGYLKHRPKRRTFAWRTAIDTNISLSAFGHFGGGRLFPGVVQGTAIGDYNRPPIIAELFFECAAGSGNDVADRVFVIPTRNANQDIDILEPVDPATHFIPQSGFVFLEIFHA